MTRTRGFTHHYRPEEVMFPRAMLCKVETNFALLIRLRRVPWKARSSQSRRGMLPISSHGGRQARGLGFRVPVPAPEAKTVRIEIEGCQ